WSHSIDNNSSDTGFDHLLNPQLDRGSSDFDVRHNFHAAFTYSIPQAPVTPFLRSLLRNWALDTTVTAQAGFPTDVFYYGPPDPTPETNVARPDLVPGVPVYISDPTRQEAGGSILRHSKLLQRGARGHSGAMRCV